MIRRSVSQLKVIEEQDPRAFEEAYNKAMLEVAKHSPKGTYTMSPGNYSGVIEYTEEIRIPENLRDQFELNGVSYICGVCPYFKLPEDKRIKKVICKEDGCSHLVDSNTPACLWLYERIASGEVKL